MQERIILERRGIAEAVYGTMNSGVHVEIFWHSGNERYAYTREKNNTLLEFGWITAANIHHALNALEKHWACLFSRDF